MNVIEKIECPSKSHLVLDKTFSYLQSDVQVRLIALKPLDNNTELRLQFNEEIMKLIVIVSQH